MKKLSNVLKQLITEKNLTISELARSVNVLQPVLHRMASGNTDNPRIDTLIPIAQYFEITIDQLVGIIPISNIQKTNSFPLLGWSNIKKYLSGKFEPSHFLETHQSASKNSYFLKVKDSTMLPLFNEDALILIDPSITPKNKDFIIIEIEEHEKPTLRQLFLDGTDNHLKPLNSEFKSTFIEKNIKNKLLGVVLEVKTILKTI